MSNTVEEMKAFIETAFAEDAKFFGGNNAAGASLTATRVA